MNTASTVSALAPADRFLRAARGETVDRAPVWLMRQAGRYLPEYQALRQKHSFVECCRSPELAQEISLQPWRRFGMDGVVVFCDILMPLTAMGIDFSVDKEHGLRLEPATATLADVAALKNPDAGSDYTYLTDTLKGLRRELGDQAAVIGFCGAPWTVATYMVAGGKTTNRETLIQQLANDPALRNAIYDKLIPMLADYMTAQVDAGAQVLQIFDTWAGILSPIEFENIAAPALHDLIARVKKQTGDKAPITLYCNDCCHLLEPLAATGCDAISIDWRVSLTEARSRLGHDIALQGNLSPEVLLTSPQQIEEMTRAMLTEGGTTGYIANLGHGVLQQTPPEHVGAFIDTVKQFTTT